MNRFPHKVLILGSGGLRIGQAGEFDYSGSQAIKALKEEGVKTVLINPNIATVQTDQDMADEVYLQPLNYETVIRIIDKERPDAVLLSVGGQTALNLGLELEAQGIFERYGIRILGTSTKTIRITEDRHLFKSELEAIHVKSAHSLSASNIREALDAAKEIGFPLMMRAGFSLGGLGSGKILTEEELCIRVAEVFNGTPQVLIEEYLEGWKEIEYEIIRDIDDNALTICNMENMDPMGIHTGESIVVAPSQTLTNQEYHFLREIALKVARRLEIVGECNIQYAFNPKNGDYRVIEVNARLSRSSALASKATGYPLAFVATKLSLGKRLDQIPNSITKKTTAFFEPSLDYIVVKIPRWDTHKLKSADRTIGSEMKSVGEVMAIGRSFPEALQKAIRMLNIGADGLGYYPEALPFPEKEIEKATDRRLFALGRFFQQGGTVEHAAKLSHINPWFLEHLQEIILFEKKLEECPLSSPLLRTAKKMGFSDKQIASLQKSDPETIRQYRIKHEIIPVIKQIDTLAGEFSAETNYLYMTYHGTHSDVIPCEIPSILVLGSGPYCIGSSVEFDWCAVNTVKTLRKLNEKSILINSNPETVSTDYDVSDRLYFEELTLERVRDIADFEHLKGIIVSVGGQIANNLAYPLHEAGYALLGTTAESIDCAENREKFSLLLNRLGIDQPEWETAKSLEMAQQFAHTVGYPILVRPSYVLSGAAMNVVANDQELKRYLSDAFTISSDKPIVISQFIVNAKELEVDGVAFECHVIIEAISEHIENAGIHSGDATIVLPPQKLYLETIRRTKKMTREIVRALKITGPFNIQFIAKDNAIKVIECNVRASRSFPFVSKAINHNLIEISTEALLGRRHYPIYETLEQEHVAVKTALFPYKRFKGSNPVAHVEMASTGEVACLGDHLLDAFYMSWLSTEQAVKGKNIMISIGGDKKIKFLPLLQKLEEQGWEIFATENTHDYLCRNGIASNFLYKASQQCEPNVITQILNREFDLIINIPRTQSSQPQVTDGFKIRRFAIDNHIPLITNFQNALIFLQCLLEVDLTQVPIKSLREYTLKKSYFAS